MSRQPEKFTDYNYMTHKEREASSFSFDMDHIERMQERKRED